MAVGDAHVFPGLPRPVLTQLFFPKPPTTFLTCFNRGERRKYAGKKVLLNRGSNSQPPGHESDTLTTEPPGWGLDLGENGRSTSRQYKAGKKFWLIPTCMDWAGWHESILITDRLSLYKTIPTYNDPTGRELLKTVWEKEKMLLSSIFFLFPQCFLSYQRQISSF